MVVRATCAAGLALTLLASSCTPATPAPSGSSRSSRGASHLELIEAENDKTIDPALIDDPTSLAIGSEIFQGLTRLDQNQRPVSSLADRWEISDAGRTYTFHLRSAQYQSGATVQAQDAVPAWTRALAPGTASPLTIFFSPLGVRYPGDSLSAVQVVDSKTLRLRLPQPNSELLTLLALPPYWLADPKQPSSGSGPYHLDRWDHGRALHLSAFDGYWGARPSVRKVDIEIEPDNAKRLDRFTSGAADVAHGFTGPQLLAFARDPAHTAELHKVPTARTTWLGFNTSAGSGYGAPDLQDQISSATGRSVVLHPIGDFFNQAALDKLPFFIDTWSADVPYPSDILENVLRANAQFNNLRLFDPEIERGLDQGRAAASWEAALAAYQQAEGVAVTQNRVIPLYSGVEPYLVKPGLHIPFIGRTIATRWEEVR